MGASPPQMCPVITGINPLSRTLQKEKTAMLWEQLLTVVGWCAALAVLARDVNST